MHCVVLAGGLGTRMQEVTANKVPKAMLPVLGRPFIDHQLELLARRGVTDVVLSLGFLGEMVEAYVGDGSRWGLRVRCVHDGDEPRGTAGALRAVLETGLLADPFMLLYGDSYLDMDLEAVRAAFDGQLRPAMMVVYRNEGAWDTSNVRFGDGIVSLYQKNAPPEVRATMPWIDHGVSVLRRSVIEQLVPSRGAYDLADVYHRLSIERLLAGYEATERFYEVGSLTGLEGLEEFLRSVRPPSPSPSPSPSASPADRPQVVLLDRDGVLNAMVIDADHGRLDSPMHPDQVTLLPGVPEAVARLHAAGYLICVVTNQPSAAKGKTTRANLDAVQARVLEGVQSAGGVVHNAQVCFHRSEDGCACRKPKTGMLEAALASVPGARPQDCWMVGDGVTDVQAGATFGAKTAYLGPRKCDACAIFDSAGSLPTMWVRDMPEFVQRLLHDQAPTWDSDD